MESAGIFRKISNVRDGTKLSRLFNIIERERERERERDRRARQKCKSASAFHRAHRRLRKEKGCNQVN